MSAWLEAGFATHRPRAIAALTRVFRDLDLAEDAFADACLKALESWPKSGIPRDPFAWLLTVARNAGMDRVRKADRRRRIFDHKVAPVTETSVDATPDPDELRDDVLRLLFLCCHPALKRQDQLALALKVVGGLSVDEVARAFLVKPRTMEQRLTRAKQTIAANPVPFETPSPADRAHRLGEVALMVYLMFNEGWSASTGPAQTRTQLCDEAIRLARLLVELFPGMCEMTALLALLLFQHSRRKARQDADGNLLTLDQQDRTLWDRTAIAEAQALLHKAGREGRNGPYRIQAAIAAEHARAARATDTDWPRIEALYQALHAQQPTPVVQLNLLATRARTHDPESVLADLESLAEPLADYRWFHTLHADLLARAGRPDAACDAYRRALELGPTAPERRAIEAEIEACGHKTSH